MRLFANQTQACDQLDKNQPGKSCICHIHNIEEHIKELASASVTPFVSGAGGASNLPPQLEKGGLSGRSHDAQTENREGEVGCVGGAGENFEVRSKGGGRFCLK